MSLTCMLKRDIERWERGRTQNLDAKPRPLRTPRLGFRLFEVSDLIRISHWDLTVCEWSSWTHMNSFARMLLSDLKTWPLTSDLLQYRNTVPWEQTEQEKPHRLPSTQVLKFSDCAIFEWRFIFYSKENIHIAFNIHCQLFPKMYLLWLWNVQYIIVC